MHEAEETEVDIVEVTKADVVVEHMVTTKQVKTTRHQVEDEVSEAEAEEDYNKEINFRKKGDGTYEGTTWQIKFMLKDVDRNGTYKLRLALATAHLAELQVRVNDTRADPPIFTTGQIGHDNTIARHGIHGLYRLYNIDVAGVELVEGENIIFLTQAINIDPLQGIMYDYIRLECPASSST
ncbi:hypothetical protein GQ457_03G034490 [Hibiscus cannabinus]